MADFDRYGRSGGTARNDAFWHGGDNSGRDIVGRVEDLESAALERVRPTKADRRGGSAAAGTSAALEPREPRGAAGPRATGVSPAAHPTASAAPARCGFVRAVRAVRSARSAGRDPTTHPAPGFAGSIGDSGEGEIQRVGGRPRLRREVIALTVGALFLTGAMLKPWGGGSALPSATAGSSGTPVLLAIAPAIPGSSSTPPWNVGGPQPGLTNTPDSGPDVLGELTQRWAAVDWGVLGTADSHAKWGVSAVLMPDLTTVPKRAVSPPPKIAWTSAVGLALPATISISPGNRIYGLALTWPASERVASVRFQFVGGPDESPYLPPAGFPPFTKVDALSAELLAIPSASPTKAPSYTGELRSGGFWVPPADASVLASTSVSLASAWVQLPWAWPMGLYRVTVVTAAGTTQIPLRLQLA